MVTARKGSKEHLTTLDPTLTFYAVSRTPFSGLGRKINNVGFWENSRDSDTYRD